MCGDQGVWLFPPSCSLIPGGVLEDFSQQENKQGKPKGTDRVSPQQPAQGFPTTAGRPPGVRISSPETGTGNFQDIP